MRVMITLVALLSSSSVYSQHYVDGYCRSDGRCVQGYFKTAPNGNASDNFGSAGNLNPNNGRISTRTQDLPNTGRTADGYVYQVGPRGGEYRVTEGGRRAYRNRDR